MILSLNHVAVAVKDLEKAAAFYSKVLGCSVSVPHDLPEQDVRVVSVKLNNTNIELIAPLSEHSPVTKFLEKNPKGGLHHLCFEVEDLEQALHTLKEHHIYPLSPPTIGENGKPVIFLHPRDGLGVLIELT